MRAVVTGSAGFIGPHLIDRFLSDGNEVVAIDDLSTGDLNSLREYMGRRGFTFHQLDIREYNCILSVLEDCDAVFHLAAQTSVEESVKDPLQTNSINVGGTLTMIKASVQRSVRRFIFASSAAIYGVPSELPLRESSPTIPISPYGASKLSCEHYVNVFNRIYGLETVILRIFNVYGHGQRSSPYAGVITKFAEAIRQDKHPTIFGDGKQVRDFIYIDDCVDALIRSAVKRTANGQTINVGTGRKTTINELAQIMIGLSGKKQLKPKFASERPGDIRESYADVTRAMEILDFRAKIDMEQGLSRLFKNL